MKKTISILMCAAMLFELIPKVTFAAEINRKSVKSGIEKGDIVSFAGKDGTPIRWRVIDADKDNTGNNPNGIFLLSEDTAEKVAVNNISCDADSLTECFKPTYTAFYDKYFADFYRNAVMKTTVSDLPTTIGAVITTFKGKLSDDAVFALSISEAKELDVDERKYGDKNWILRSARRRRNSMTTQYMYEFAYVDSNNIDSAGQNTGMSYDEITKDNTKVYYFRPAVNIDKTKLAQLDGKPLLLPAGEFDEASNELAALGTASEWKLTQKNSDVKITRTNVAAHGKNKYTITVGTDLAAADGDDCIALIIKKADGSISHYGRYAMTAAEKSFELTLPSDVDNTNDTAYIFYENYKGNLSGSAGELTEICLHEYSCTDIADNTHKLTCTKCGDTCTENHVYDKITSGDDKNVSCTVCGKQEPFMVQKVDFNAVPVFNGKETAVRTEYDTSSLKPVGCTITEMYNLFTNLRAKKFSYIPKGEKGGITFRTKTPVRATGFRVAINKKDTVPNNIILSGKKSGSSDEYKEIGSAFLKPILSEETSYEQKTYAFLFTDTTNFAAYDDFKLEMDNDGDNDIELKYFGLLSDKGSSFTVAADGAMVDGYSPNYAYPNEDLEFTLISKNGHPKISEMSLTIDGETQGVNPIYDYNEDTGVFRIPGSKIEIGKEYVLNVTCSDKSINVNFELNRATVIEKTENLELGNDYSCVFRDANGETAYAPARQDIEVLCGGNDITENCRYTNYTLNIPGKYVTGDLTITAYERFCVQKETSRVKVERAGETTRWYDGYYSDSSEMLKNINAGGDVKVTILRNSATIDELILTAGNVTLDLNNFKVYSRPITVGAGVNLTMKNGTYTVNLEGRKSVVENGAILTLENVSTSAINVRGKLIVNNTLANKKINDILLQQESEFVLKRGEVDNLKLYQPESVKIYRGKIGNTSSYKDDSDAEALAIDYNGLLGESCEFYNITSQEAFDKGEPTGFSVKCLHSIKNIDTNTGICICGEQVSKILTENGGDVIFYDDILKAIEYANQNADTTIRIFNNITTSVGENDELSSSVQFSGINTTLDLNGKTLSITDMDAYISVTGTLCVVGNGVLNVLQLIAENGSTLVIESGTFGEVYMVSNNVTLNGGKFTELRKDNLEVFGNYLGKEKAYRGTDTGKFNSSMYEQTWVKSISNVEIVDVPFSIVSHLEDKYLDAGAKYTAVSLEVKANENYKDKIQYKWSVDKVEPKGIIPYAYSDKGNYPEFAIPIDGLDGGAHLRYECKVSCEGYEMRSNNAVVTIGAGKPSVDIDSKNNYVVDAKGNDCVLIAAAYSGNRLLGTKFRELKKESGILKLNDILSLSEITSENDGTNVSEIKLFFWDSLNGMMPLNDSTSVNENVAR